MTPRTGWPYLDDDGVLALAHRGGAGHPELVGLENTRTAFAHAVSLGYRYLETDVHTTRDGVLVTAHDADLDGVAIVDLAATDPRLERVPAFVELLEAFPGARFNVDLKSDGAVAALADLLDTCDDELADRLLVGSFDPRRIRRFRRLTRGRVATAADPAEVAVFRLCPLPRLATLLAPGCAALQVPERRGPVRVVTAGLVRRAHAAGLHVHVWTVDEPALMHRLLDLGVDGIVTDRTDLLVEVLRERGQWPTG